MMFKRIPLFLSSFTLILLLSVPKKSLAQFTYIEGGFSYQFLKFHKGDLGLHNGTRVSSFNFNLAAVCRPIRNFGLGLELSAPIHQHHNFGFSSTLSDGEPFTGYSSEYGENQAVIYFSPYKYDYIFKVKPKATFLFRYYVDTKANFYLSFRPGITAISEEFIFKRSYKTSVQYGDATEENIDYTKVHNLFVPGFGLGIAPHLSKHLFMDLSFAMDFYPFSDPGFFYPISYDDTDYGYGGSAVNMNFRSQATGTKVAINFKFGMGYYF